MTAIKNNSMESFFNTLKRFWTTLRKIRARLLAHLYAHNKTRSSPVRIGNYTVFFETYCPNIERICNNLDIIIQEPLHTKSFILVRWYLSIRFNWPNWPIQCVTYKGKLQKLAVRSPNNIAEHIQFVFDQAIEQSKEQGKAPYHSSTQCSQNKTKQETAPLPLNAVSPKRIALNPSKIADEQRKNYETIDIINRHFKPEFVEQ